MSLIAVAGRRAALLLVAALAVVAVLAAGLSGCAGVSPDDGASAADWAREQPGVLEATATADPSPFSGVLDVAVTVDPALDDEAVRTLVREVSGHYRDAGWAHPTVVYSLGEGRFSDREDAFLPLFLRWREDGGVAGVELVDSVSRTVETASPDDMLDQLARVQELVRESGGVQSNLTLTVHDEPETIRATGTYTALPEDAIAVLPGLVQGVPVVRMEALAIETGAQVVTVVVPDEASRALVAGRAATLSAIDVRVWTLSELEG